MKIREKLLFEVLRTVKGIPTEKLLPVEDSKFKSIAVRRNLVTLGDEALKEYMGKMEEIQKILTKAQEGYNQFMTELNQVDTGENSEEKKAKTEAEKVQEVSEFTKKFEKETQDKLDAIGKTFMVVKDNQRIVLLDSEKEVDFKFAPEHEARQAAWLKEHIEKFGPEFFYVEEDLVDVGTLLGI